jgi:phosphopantetheine adenylyltransferase
LIKEVSALGADISDLVPDFVARAIRKKLRRKQGISVHL